MTLLRFCLTLSMASLATISVAGQNAEPASVLAGRPDQNTSTRPASIAGLGPTFESRAAGIAFKPPANSTQNRSAVAGDEIVRYVNEDKKWNLRVSQMVLSKAMPLAKTEDKAGAEQNGILEYLTAQIENEIPGAEIKRQDVINVGDSPVGMIAARYQLGLDTVLKQQAIFPAYTNEAPGVRLESRTSKAFYIFDMTSPAPKTGKLEDDANVKEAVDIFGRMLDSAKLLDQTDLKQDLVDRKIRTRGLLVNLTPSRIRAAMVPEQWLRVMHDGKDVGYSYIVEQVAQDLPRKGVIQEAHGAGDADGVLVGIRSRMSSDADRQVDIEKWMFVTLNRRHEAWQTTNLTQNSKGAKESSAEYGASDLKSRSMIDSNLERGELTKKGEDKQQPPVRIVDQYSLNVNHVSKTAQKPLNTELSPWYLPQALTYMLPRLVFANEGKSYLFLTYVSEQNEVVNRFVDVGYEREVDLAGQKVRAITVTDRIGYEGARTVHYIAPDGKYLGSVNADTGITVLPTDAATLEKLWKNVNLTRPGEIEPTTAPEK